MEVKRIKTKSTGLYKLSTLVNSLSTKNMDLKNSHSKLTNKITQLEQELEIRDQMLKSFENEK